MDSILPRPKSVARRSAQTAIWRIGEALVRLLAPIMSFYFKKRSGTICHSGQGRGAGRERAPSAVSFHRRNPRQDGQCGERGAATPSEKTGDDWTTLRAVAADERRRHKALEEEARNNKLIGTGLEARSDRRCIRSNLFCAVAARRPVALLFLSRFGGDSNRDLRKRHGSGAR